MVCPQNETVVLKRFLKTLPVAEKVILGIGANGGRAQYCRPLYSVGRRLLTIWAISIAATGTTLKYHAAVKSHLCQAIPWTLLRETGTNKPAL